jgi:hypothetical protein
MGERIRFDSPVDTEFGEKLVAAFGEMAAYMAGEPNECEVEEYEPTTRRADAQRDGHE